MSMPPSSLYSSKLVDLAGKTVLITGATAGIGKAIALRLGELRCNLVLVGRREDRLQEVKQEVMEILEKQEKQKQQLSQSELDSQHFIDLIPLDITDIEQTKQLLLIPKYLSSVEILINNAGLALGTNAADETPYEDMFQMFNVNMIAAANLTQEFGKKMRERQQGHVVFISSVAGKEFYEGGSVYCATKFAMNGYAMSYRCDVAHTPIRVTTISPGLCQTEFSQVRFNKDPDGGQEKAEKVYSGIVPLFPADVADNVVYVLTRPRHVQIADISLYPTNQGHAKWCVKREGESLGAK